MIPELLDQAANAFYRMPGTLRSSEEGVLRAPGWLGARESTEGWVSGSGAP